MPVQRLALAVWMLLTAGARAPQVAADRRTHACDDQRSADFLYYHFQCLQRNNFDPAWDDYCFAEARLLADNEHNQCYQECDFCWAQDGTGSPIVIQLNNGRPRISDLAGGIVFDLDADGIPQQVAWPLDDPLLAVDPEGDGITSGIKLFGNFSPQVLREGEAPNGFAALRAYDVDGDLLVAGTELAPLLLWWDFNRNGVSDPGETVASGSILRSINTSYSANAGRDRNGNRFRYSSAAELLDGRHTRAIDVFLLME